MPDSPASPSRAALLAELDSLRRQVRTLQRARTQAENVASPTEDATRGRFRQLLEKPEASPPTRRAGTVMDITDRKRAEAAVMESEQRYRNLMESCPLAVVLHSKGIIRYANPEAGRTLGGGDARDLLGRPMIEFVHAEHRQAVGRRIHGHFSAEKAAPRFEERFVRVDGTAFDAEVVEIPCEFDGEPAVQVVVVDISSRKSADRERDLMIQQLERQNAELERFTYTVSHDLKSPLITISGFLSLIERDASLADHENVRPHFQHIHDAVRRMDQLLHELLELSRVGRIANPSEQVSLAELARQATDSATLKCPRLRVEVAGDLPTVVGDRVRLMEVFQNLIDNAVKFTGDVPDPRITVGVESRDGVPVVFVQDNGVGIEPGYCGNVFGLFEKLDPESEGSGIGLAIVKRIVEVHGGRVWAESQGIGRGAKFCFVIGSGNGAHEAS